MHTPRVSLILRLHRRHRHPMKKQTGVRICRSFDGMENGVEWSGMGWYGVIGL